MVARLRGLAPCALGTNPHPTASRHLPTHAEWRAMPTRSLASPCKPDTASTPRTTSPHSLLAWRFDEPWPSRRTDKSEPPPRRRPEARPLRGRSAGRPVLLAIEVPGSRGVVPEPNPDTPAASARAPAPSRPSPWPRNCLPEGWCPSTVSRRRCRPRLPARGRGSAPHHRAPGARYRHAPDARQNANRRSRYRCVER